LALSPGGVTVNAFVAGAGQGVGRPPAEDEAEGDEDGQDEDGDEGGVQRDDEDVV